MPHVQHAYFHSLDQSNSLLVALSLTFPSLMLKLPKGLAKLGNIVAETMFLDMFPGVPKLGNICFGRKICVREAKMFLTPWQKHF